MKALVLQEPGRLVCRDMPMPEPGYGELLVQTKACTICTSDLADIRHNPFGIRLPMIMGHEGAGVVAGIGAGVEGFTRGDAVTCHPFMQCLRCDSCRRGVWHLCDDMEHLGINKGGGFAEYFVIRADRARLIPYGVSFSHATLMEPVSVCLEALNQAHAGKGKNVLIIGDGPFGILNANLAALFEPARVILLGRHPFRMAYANNVTCIHEPNSLNIQSDILNATNGEGIDCAILCAASGQAVELGLNALRSRGTLCIFSAVTGHTPIDLFKVHVKELNIVGSCNDDNCMDEALSLIAENKHDICSVITHELPFADWENAFHLAEKGRDKALKVSLVL